MAKFWVNTGHTLYHAGRQIIHAGEEIAEEVLAIIKRDAAHFKSMLENGIITDEKPVLNPATDMGAPSQMATDLRPVRTAPEGAPTDQSAGPTQAPQVQIPAPPAAGGAAPQVDNAGKPLTSGLKK